MNRIKGAMTRKIGPLAAWAWLLLVGGILYYRRKFSGGASSVSGTGTGSVTPGPNATPQDPLTLQPGESAYNPNTGTLTTAPGTDPNANSGGLSAADAAAAAADQAAALAAAAGGGSGGGGDTSPIAATVGPPAGGVFADPSKRKVTPTSKRQPKGKGQRQAKGKTSKHQTAAHKTVPRSATHQRHANGGRTLGGLVGPVLKQRANRVAKNTPRATSRAPVVPTAPQRSHQRTKTPAVVATVQQRRVAATQPPHQRATPAALPRPSAPAPRTQRAPARAPAKPVVRKRK